MGEVTDRDAMREADYVSDRGPGAWMHGGMVVSRGTPAQIAADPASMTGQYLSLLRFLAAAHLVEQYAVVPKRNGVVRRQRQRDLVVSFRLPCVV